MDAVAHLTFGFLCALLINRKWKLDRFLFVIIIAAGDLPDIDTQFFGLLGYDNLHGGPTHTILGVFVIALIIAAIFWLVESVWINKSKSPGIQEDKSAWDLKRLELFIFFAFIGGLIHLGVDIFNTSNEYARYHHLYLWPFSDYSFHLDLMLAGMPDNRMDAWQFRPLVNYIIMITNIILISILWILHFKSDKHLWEPIYSDKQYYLQDNEPKTPLRRVQQFLDSHRVYINYLLLIICTIAFVDEIIKLAIRVSTGV